MDEDNADSQLTPTRCKAFLGEAHMQVAEILVYDVDDTGWYVENLQC